MELSSFCNNYSMTALVSAFFTVGHHHNYESLARRAAIITLVKYFTIDVLDTVDILEILFETNEISEEHVSLFTQNQS